MNLFALSPTQEAGGQIALAAVLGAVGFFFLLPRPRGRFVPGGIAALVASAAVFGAWVCTTFGRPLPDIIGTALFGLFSTGALVFGAVLVAQKNPARGAIAFAFVVLSTCGLFLLLAAPFLMAATIIIYAGAIIVTFLFVLMLSHADGASNENDRSREPLYGAFAGFAFVGLVLFTLYQTAQTSRAADTSAPGAQTHLLAQVVTAEERTSLAGIATRLEDAEKLLDGDASTHTARAERLVAFEDAYRPIKNDLAQVVGGAYSRDSAPVRDFSELDAIADQHTNGSIHARLVRLSGHPNGDGASLFREDEQARAGVKRAAGVRETSAKTFKTVRQLMNNEKPDPAAAKAAVRELRDEVVLLRGSGDLPASNVRGLGFVLYSEHLLAIELAGTLLLVAVIGAVAVTHRKGGAK
ncbi:NADH-quinone oxidoreductase subunit J [Gemmata sp. G18]|uniref:NADH-quinone oxidoreductase subunit J n=1 Tax=Gemmata palustris TaxID=2822762 RepID=A0ABS5BLU3_9BACT|nr:NADH-quinone oxidoreductase subunit J [Gemmata palustris]MBP3954275.1 NADH-quinone oxidoreductase subunit J [Gemmata palustris]